MKRRLHNIYRSIRLYVNISKKMHSISSSVSRSSLFFLYDDDDRRTYTPVYIYIYFQNYRFFRQRETTTRHTFFHSFFLLIYLYLIPILSMYPPFHSISVSSGPKYNRRIFFLIFLTKFLDRSIYLLQTSTRHI